MSPQHKKPSEMGGFLFFTVLKSRLHNLKPRLNRNDVRDNRYRYRAYSLYLQRHMETLWLTLSIFRDPPGFII